MHDAGVGRHDAEIVERGLTPAQERVTFLVALEFDLVVEIERICGAIVVDLHGVVDDQLGRRQRVDLVGGAAEFDDGIAHGGEVDDGRHAREVLQDDARRA